METGYKGFQGSVLGLNCSISLLLLQTVVVSAALAGLWVPSNRGCSGFPWGKDLDSLEGWSCVNLTELNKAKGHPFNSFQYM